MVDLDLKYLTANLKPYTVSLADSKYTLHPIHKLGNVYPLDLYRGILPVT